MPWTPKILLSLALIPLGLFAQPEAIPAGNPGSGRPNFVIINIDDLGYRAIGPFGSTNPTPALDRMAAEGRKLTAHYAAPVCTPSRVALLTGCYPKRALPIPEVLFPDSAIGLSPDEKTVAEVLQEAGYATACIGKWHLGDQPEFLPRQQGFDYFFGLPYSNDMGPAADGAKSDFGRPLPRSNPARQVPPAATPETGLRSGQPPLALMENNTVIGRVRATEQLGLLRRYTDKSIAFIQENRRRPFLVYLAHNAVHFPLYPAENFRSPSGQNLLGDWVREVDASVGEILDTLRSLSLDRSTLVLFVSDNGGPVRQGADNLPLRGGKDSTLEGGVRVPALVWWPGQIPAASSTSAITTMMDVLPTFARLARAPLPVGRKIDGVDVWPVLSGAPAVPPRDTFLYFRGLRLEAVRSGPWKLHLAKSELYDLVADIGEANDLAATHPEVVARLTALAESTKGDLGLEGVGPGCRPPGRVPQSRPLIAADGTVSPAVAGSENRFP